MIDIKILLLCIILVLGLFFIYKYFTYDSDDKNIEQTVFGHVTLLR